MRSSSPALTVVMLAVLTISGCGKSDSTSAEQASEPSHAERLLAQRERRQEAHSARESQEASEARAAQQRAKAKLAKQERQKAAARRAKAEEEATVGIAPLTEEIYEGFSGVDRSNFQIAYEVCGIEPISKLASEWHTSSDPSSIAHAYGLEYREYARPAVEEGCLRGMIDSRSQYEAELEANSQL